MRRVVVAVAGATLSALYWWLVATLAFGLVAGDPGPAAAPRPDGEQQAIAVAVIAAAILAYAAASLAWERVTRRRLR